MTQTESCPARCVASLPPLRAMGSSALFVVLVSVSAVPSPPTFAVAATPIAVAYCTACASLADLQGAAKSWFTTNPSAQNAILLLSSLSKPISGFFGYLCTGLGHSQCSVRTITASTMAAGTLDNQIFARAAKVPPLVTPPTMTQTTVDEEVIGWIQTQLVANGQQGIDKWHLLTGAPLVQWFQFTDTQTGKTVTVYVGDTITVNYPNGYSEQFQFLGIGGMGGGTLQWKRVPNSLMHNGKPVSQASSSPASPVPGSGSYVGITSPWVGGSISAWADLHWCTGTATVGITNSDGTVISSTGFFVYPC